LGVLFFGGAAGYQAAPPKNKKLDTDDLSFYLQATPLGFKLSRPP
jgi:hypothetical protein